MPHPNGSDTQESIVLKDIKTTLEAQEKRIEAQEKRIAAQEQKSAAQKQKIDALDKDINYLYKPNLMKRFLLHLCCCYGIFNPVGCCFNPDGCCCCCD